MTESSYVLRGGSAAAERLAVLAQVFGPTTSALLDTVGIEPGSRCLDVGCGIGAVTRELGKRTGPGGQALGVDFDGGILEVAKELSAGSKPVRFERRSLEELPAGAEYDVVYARFLLTHLKEPRAALERLAAVVRPGGTLVLEDVEFPHLICYPPSEALHRTIQWYVEASRRMGGDPQIGPKLFTWMRELGLGTRARHVQPLLVQGPEKRLHVPTLEHIRENVQKLGIATAREIAEVAEALHIFTENPGTLVSTPRIFQVWGRVPEE